MLFRAVLPTAPSELLIESATGALGIAPYNISWTQHCRTDAQESLAWNSEKSEFGRCRFDLTGRLDFTGQVEKLGGGQAWRLDIDQRLENHQ